WRRFRLVSPSGDRRSWRASTQLSASTIRMPKRRNAAPAGGLEAGGAAIRVSDVTKTFVLDDGATVTALRRMSLRLDRGEFVALLGPSGCGKSTVLRLIASLEEPTEGTVEIDRRPPAHLAKRHRLGVAFQ